MCSWGCSFSMRYRRDARTVQPDSKILSSAVREILGSRFFQRSYRLSQLLAYLAEQTLKQDFESLKECVIGHHVFHRPATYNPAEDNIVRANIHQLRSKLSEYYTTTGAADIWRITVPKGSYALSLERWPGEAASPAETPEAERFRYSVPLVRKWTHRRIAVSSFLVVIAAFCLSVYVGSQSKGASRIKPATCLLDLLAPNPGQRLTVVVPDANVVPAAYLSIRTHLPRPRVCS